MTTRGEVLGSYTLVNPIGEGPLGRVWQANDSNGAVVALKLLKPTVASQMGAASVLERLPSSVQACQALKHAGLIKLFGVLRVPDDGVRGLAMEYVEGHSLALVKLPPAVCEGKDPYTLAELLRWFGDLSELLHWLHGQGFVHGNIKPTNVMLVPSPEGERVKLLDLAWSGIGALVKPGGPSMLFMAPEQKNGHPPSALSDQWAVAAMLSHMLSRGEGELTLGTLPAVLVMSIKRALSEAPEKRFHQISELSQAFQAIRTELERGAQDSQVRPRVELPVFPSAVPTSDPRSPSAREPEVPRARTVTDVDTGDLEEKGPEDDALEVRVPEARVVHAHETGDLDARAVAAASEGATVRGGSEPGPPPLDLSSPTFLGEDEEAESEAKTEPAHLLRSVSNESTPSIGVPVAGESSLPLGGPPVPPPPSSPESAPPPEEAHDGPPPRRPGSEEATDDLPVRLSPSETDPQVLEAGPQPSVEKSLPARVFTPMHRPAPSSSPENAEGYAVLREEQPAQDAPKEFVRAAPVPEEVDPDGASRWARAGILLMIAAGLVLVASLFIDPVADRPVADPRDPELNQPDGEKPREHSLRPSAPQQKVKPAPARGRPPRVRSKPKVSARSGRVASPAPVKPAAGGDVDAALALLAQTSGDRPPSAELREAAKLVGQACQRGRGRACLVIAHHYLKEDSSVSRVQAREAFDKGCEAGHGEACLRSGQLWESAGTAETRRRARAVYQRGCEYRVAFACHHAARLWASGEGSAPDQERADRFEEKACDLGRIASCDAVKARRQTAGPPQK